MLCSICGAEMPEGGMFCPGCGNRMTFDTAPFKPISVPVQPAAPAPQQAPQTPAFTGAPQNIREAPQPNPAPRYAQQPAPQYTPAPQYAQQPAPQYVQQPPPQYNPYRQPPQYTQPPQQPAKPPKEKKPLNKKLLIGIIAGVLVLALAAIALFVWPGFLKSEKTGSAGVLYVKDYEIYYNELKGGESVRVSEKLSRKSDESSIRNYAETFSKRSADGTVVFYPEQIDGYTATLYCRRTDKPDEEPVKVDSKVSFLQKVDKNGEYAIYRKDGSIYRFTVKTGESEKLATDVSDWEADGDYENLCWLDDNGRVYLKKQGEEKIKLASNVDRLYAFENGFVYFGCEDDEDTYTVYKSDGGDKVKLFSGANDVKWFGNGVLWYNVKEEETLRYSDFITDDMAAEDRAEREYPSYWDYEDGDEYDRDLEAYYAWENRQEIREQLNSESGVMDFNLYKAYCYNGSESVLIAEHSGGGNFYSEKLGIIVTLDLNNVEPVRLSEYTYFYALTDAVETSLERSASYSLALGTELYATGLEDVFTVYASDDGDKLMFFVNEETETETGDTDDDWYYEPTYNYTYTLYEVRVADGKPEKAKLYAEGVQCLGEYLPSGAFYYGTDYDRDSDTCTLYIDGKMITDEAYANGTYLSVYETEAGILFRTDYNSEDSSFTLNLLKDGKTEELLEDVCRYTVSNAGVIIFTDYSARRDTAVLNLLLPDGTLKEIADESYMTCRTLSEKGIAYLVDWDNNEGDLYVWKDGKATLIDTGVNIIIG